MEACTFVPVRTDEDIQQVADLATVIWHEHFPPIIGEDQVDYMVEKFQSYPAISAQIKDDGYEYYKICDENGAMVGYIGVCQEGDDSLFLSKFYIKKEERGKHLAAQTLNYLIAICEIRGLDRIWLTCNKHNDNTLAIYDHLGFEITDSQVTDIGNGYVMDDYVLTYNIGADD